MIELDSNYRITSDSRQFMLQKFSGKDKKSGKDVFNSVAYSQEPTHLVKEYSRRSARASDATSLHDLVVTYQSTVKRLEKLLENVKLK